MISSAGTSAVPRCRPLPRNAGRIWTPEEEQRLIARFSSGLTVFVACQGTRPQRPLLSASALQKTPPKPSRKTRSPHTSRAGPHKGHAPPLCPRSSPCPHLLRPRSASRTLPTVWWILIPSNYCWPFRLSRCFFAPRLCWRCGKDSWVIYPLVPRGGGHRIRCGGGSRCRPLVRDRFLPLPPPAPLSPSQQSERSRNRFKPYGRGDATLAGLPALRRAVRRFLPARVLAHGLEQQLHDRFLLQGCSGPWPVEAAYALQTQLRAAENADTAP